jgi:hypothetical protein
MLVSATLVMDEEDEETAQVTAGREQGARAISDPKPARDMPESLIVENVVMDEVPTSSSFLCTPTRVPIAEAVPLDEGQVSFKTLFKSRKVRLTAVGLIVVTILCVVILVLVILRRPEENVTPPPMSAPTTAPTELYVGDKDSFVLNLLPDYSLEALNDSSSPQSRSLEWLWKDPVATGLLPNFRKVQRFALATSFFSLTRADLTVEDLEGNTGWLADTHECLWPTNTAAAAVCRDGRYILLDTSRYDLPGTIPPEIALLTDLASLDLSESGASGGIPTHVGLMTSLEHFRLNDNWIVSLTRIMLSRLSDCQHCTCCSP